MRLPFHLYAPSQVGNRHFWRSGTTASPLAPEVRALAARVFARAAVSGDQAESRSGG